MQEVSQFGYLRINGYSLLPAAFRSVLRPSSPLNAKASSECPFALDSLKISLFSVSLSRSIQIPRVSLSKKPKFSIHKEQKTVFSLPSSHYSKEPKSFQKAWNRKPKAPYSKPLEWRWTESNRRPHACGACALPTELHPPSQPFKWRWTESNRRPQTCKACAPPIELHPQIWWAREDLNLRPHAYQACALTD